MQDNINILCRIKQYDGMIKDNEKILRILERLEELKKRGLISEEYYQEKRNMLLSMYLEDRERIVYPPKILKSRERRYVKIGILIASMIFVIVFVSFIVVGYINASSVTVLSAKLIRVSSDSILVKVIFNNPSAHPNYITRCSYEVKLDGSSVYKGELNDLILPAGRTEELILDIPMKMPIARKYLAKVMEDGLLDGKIEIMYVIPALFLNMIQTPITINKYEIKEVQTPRTTSEACYYT